ncbi:class II glutamine amidotransferase [Luethyella okanaganae]|uniref:Class II glutamine amidotransferase n=1 Tax=Luethyella okanaganae TaxID=69372 RepID=A0ABW1VJ53_9MICO
MCRLLAIVSPHETTVAAELGSDRLNVFASLSRVHQDGWGWVHLTAPGETPLLHTSVRAASEDPDFRAALSTDIARAAIVHLRWATSGLAVEARNTHPFLADGVAFAHNGSLKPIDELRRLVDEESRSGLNGTTDSEMYFAIIRQHLRDGGDLPAAVLAAVRELRPRFPVSSLNAMLLDATRLVVVHASARSLLPPEDIDEIRRSDLPDEHLEDYFALRWTRRADGTLLIGSTGVGESDWLPMPSESVATIELGDGSVSVTAIVQD